MAESVNVQVLSNALNLFTNAIQAASTPNRTSVNVTIPQEQAQVSRQTIGGHVPTTSPAVNAKHLLPSYLKRKGTIGVNSSKRKKAKAVSSWDRDIVCLPKQTKNGEILNVIPYPRNRYRAELGAGGLIGKVHITSEMTVEDVQTEVRSVFKEPMKGSESFQFIYLQPTGGGNRSLTVPVLSTSYEWTPQQVAKLSNAKGSIYIMAIDNFDFEVDGSCDDTDFDDGTGREKKLKTNNEEAPSKPLRKRSTRIESTRIDRECERKSSGECSYRKYLDIIDLTGDGNEDVADSDSDKDYMPLPQICMTSQIVPSNRKVSKRSDYIEMKHVLIEHQRKVIVAEDEEDFQRINIRRRHVFNDALRAFSKPSFNVVKLLKVKFIGEVATVDDGGPRREFFSLLIKEIFLESGLFSGWPSNVVVLHNIQALSKNRYYCVGKMLSVCLIQGGLSPSCFCAAIADFLVHGSVRVPAAINDIPDHDVQQLLFKVQEAATNEQLKVLLSHPDYQFIYDCGYSKPADSHTMKDRDDLIRSVWLYYIFFHPHAALEQLRAGFNETLQMELITTCYAEQLYDILVTSDAFNPTETYLIDDVVIKYSASGSNDRRKEEDIILFWTEFITSCGIEESNISLSEVLQFITGSQKIPATGLESPVTIDFTSIDQLPVARTCTCCLIVSRSWAVMTPEDFCKKMEMCML